MSDLNNLFADMGLALGKAQGGNEKPAAERTVDDWKEKISVLVEPAKRHHFYANSVLDKSFSGEGDYVIKLRLGQYLLPPNPANADVKSLEGAFPSKAHAQATGVKVLDMVKAQDSWDKLVMNIAGELIKIGERARAGNAKANARKK